MTYLFILLCFLYFNDINIVEKSRFIRKNSGRLSFLQELEKIMAGYRLSGEGYTDEEMRVLKRMCKSMLADIDEFLRKKEEKKKKERKEKKKRKERK